MGTVGVDTTLPLEPGVVWSGEPELPGLEITLSVGELAGGVWDGASVFGPVVDGSSPLVCDKFDCVLLGGR